MKIRTLFRPKIVLALLLTAIVMNALLLYFFTRLDSVVHSDLYRYGLQFNYEWAGQYWTYAWLMTSSIAIVMLVTGISIAFTLINTQPSSADSRFFNCLLLVVGIVMMGFSAFFFSRLDYVVNNDLYRYGLQFNYGWAAQYGMYAKLMLGLLGFATATTVIPLALILASTPTHEIRLVSRTRSPFKIQPAKLVCLILFAVGGIALTFSINYTSSILAFVGLGLILWGALLLYVAPAKRIKLDVLNATVSSTFTDIEKVIVDSGLKAKGIYLPPKCLEDFESSLIFIPKKTEQTPLKLEELKEERISSKNPNGMFLTPPGLALSKLFEKELGTSFTKTDLQYLGEMLPGLLVEDMEIVEKMGFSTENNTITIEMTNHIFRDVCEETKKHPRLYESIGCPLCSAVACALAKATGKPIVVDKEEQSQGGKTTRIRYHTLEG
jgi:uncharacterized membrane protein